jgi:Na+/H+ antiporter NhaD/arsenite permease-like protein
MTTRRAVAVLALCLGLATPALGAEAPAHGPVGGLGSVLPVWTVLPFVLLLLSIAILPLAVSHWWEHNRNKAIVSALLAIPFAAYLLLTYGAEGAHHLGHFLLDYLSFIALLGALFVISGGIHVKGSLAGTPLSNTAILGIGAVLANLIGTTGASVVLIRPLLRANEERKRRVHIVVFFIFVVSNCGGLLTPLGDPPLFLGFLKGVPFEWTLSLWREWLLVNGILLLVFNLVDQRILDIEEKAAPEPLLEEVLEHEPLRIEGWHNLFYLAGVVLVIVGKGRGWATGGEPWPFGLQEGLMAALAVVAYLTTRASIRRANRFTFGPIVEVAVLFAGIFVTMTAPLLILNARGAELGLAVPWQYYWATGVLSSFLDNAPTYLSFAAAASGQLGVSVEGSRYLAEFLAKGEEAAALLTAISCGAVMMGANTYIGNGPNFMVKAIAEENGVAMPSFFGYMAYSIGILIPIFIAVTLVFFR